MDTNLLTADAEANEPELWATRNLQYPPENAAWIGRLDSEGCCRRKADEINTADGWTARQAKIIGVKAVAVADLDTVEFMAWQFAVAAKLAEQWNPAGWDQDSWGEVLDCESDEMFQMKLDCVIGTANVNSLRITPATKTPADCAELFQLVADELVSGWVSLHLSHRPLAYVGANATFDRTASLGINQYQAERVVLSLQEKALDG